MQTAQVVDINYYKAMKKKEDLEADLDHIVNQVNNRVMGRNAIDLAEATKSMIELDREIALAELEITRHEEARL